MSAVDSKRIASGSSADYSAAPLPNRIYRVRLCSGESRRWRFLGDDRLFGPRWQDLESGERFSERSLSYAWEVVEVDRDAPKEVAFNEECPARARPGRA